MSSKNVINVYWAPAQFTKEDPQWNLFYSEPKPVIENLVLNTTKDSLMVKCPAARVALKNVYAFHSNIDEEINLSDLDLSADATDTSSEQYVLPTEGKLSLKRLRRSSYSGYVNVSYNLGWILFADQPLMARMVAPYHPPRTPVEGAIMATGAFDIGQWYRPMNLDYHIPYSAKKFSVKENEPLAFVEFQTEAEIKFHRYQLTPLLHNLAGECATSIEKFGPRMSLKNKYKLFTKSKMRNIVLTEIQKNLATPEETK